MAPAAKKPASKKPAKAPKAEGAADKKKKAAKKGHESYKVGRGLSASWLPATAVCHSRVG